MALRKKYTVMWLVWIMAFFAIEGAALKSDKMGDTLTEHVRDWIGTNNAKRTTMMWALRIGLGGLLAWLIPHFFTGSV